MDRVVPYLDSMQAQTGQHKDAGRSKNLLTMSAAGPDPWPSSERRRSFEEVTINDEIPIRRQEDRRVYDIPPRSRLSRSRSLSASSSASEWSKDEPEEPQKEADIVYTLAIRRRFDERSPRRVVVDEQMRQDVPFDIPFCVEPLEKPQSDFNSRATLPPRSRRSSKILEVLTKVLDSRYSSREMSKIRRLQHSPPPPISDLRLSRIARRLVLIHSDYLKEILGSLVEYYPEAAYWQSTPPVEIEEPFHVLMHHYSEIQSWIEANEEQSAQQEDNAEERAAQLKHMRVLNGFLRDDYQDKVLPTLALLTETTPTISFEMLWFLFRPGIDVYLQTSEGVSAAVVYKVERDIITIDRPYRRWYVKCWRMASNGSRVARVTCIGVIARYDGCREVTSLPVCPTGIWDAHDGGSRRAKIMQRNKISLEALRKGSLHVQYDGPDLSDGRHVSNAAVKEVIELNFADGNSTPAKSSLIIPEHGI